jgi:class 3 adenylate cyclase/CHASE2 domain-containing sensor protein
MSKADLTSPARTSRPIGALLVGLIATVAVCAGHLAELDRPSELFTLDLRFRQFSTAGPTPDIVHVDIDDDSLQQAGRWPWSRTQIAGLIDLLIRCGAKTVAMDIEMPEPQELRFNSPAEGNVGLSERITSAAEGDDWRLSSIINLVPPQFGDQDLEDLLQSHANVFLPMHIALPGAPPSPNDLTEQTRKLLSHYPTTGPAVPFPLVKERVAPQESTSSQPSTGAAAKMLSSPEFDKTCRTAYLRARALLAMQRFAVDPTALSDYAMKEGPLTPPLVTFAQTIRHSGFVTVILARDGTVRRIPLLARSGAFVYPQYALSIAANDLAGRHGGPCRWSADRSHVDLTYPDGYRLSIPVDSEGMLLINWMRSPNGPPAEHISAGKVVNIWRMLDSSPEFLRLTRAYQMRLAMKLESKALLDLLQQSVQSRVARQQMELYGEGDNPSDAAASAYLDIEKKIDRQMEQYSDEFILQDMKDGDKRFLERYKKGIAALPELLKGNRDDLKKGMDDLRKKVAGKICLIGSAATAAADFVPTPMGNHVPGVEVHANIVNTILTGKFVRQAPWWLNVLAILLAGLAVTLLATTRPLITQAAPAALVLAAAMVAFTCYVVFGRWGYWLALVAPVAAMLASFVAVTAYRQLTEERAKKHIRAMFAHALSPALVDRLIEDPSMMDLGRRELTCFFSDLQGFTPLSDRLGERATASLLRRYFDPVTEVIQNRRGGYLNKFLGDGIFAFFNAPVYQEDHATRALAAALECQEEVRKLNLQLAGELKPPVQLVMRIGLATGNVTVGDCGSTDKQDYTAIGPTVNLASRLEGANKFFHTRILAAKSTYDLANVAQASPAGGEWLARPLGKVVVVGTTEPTEIWNPMARRKDALAELVKVCDLFTEGMDAFQAGDFERAATAFRSVLEIQPDDGPAAVYLTLCQSYLATPPPEDWRIVRLTEK